MCLFSDLFQHWSNNPQYFASSPNSLQHFVIHCNLFTWNDSYWKWWHFCDDPVCPDLVWKLSMLGPWAVHTQLKQPADCNRCSCSRDFFASRVWTSMWNWLSCTTFNDISAGTVVAVTVSRLHERWHWGWALLLAAGCGKAGLWSSPCLRCSNSVFWWISGEFPVNAG